MAFRFKYIAPRFFLQSLFAILIIGILFSVLYFSESRKKDGIIATEISENILGELRLAPDMIRHAGSLQRNVADFVRTGADNLIDENQNFILAIRDSIDVIFKLKFLDSYSYKSPVPDSIKFLLERWSSSYNRYVLSLKELGNANGGALKNILRDLNHLSEELYMAPDSGAQFTEFNSYFNAFTISYSQSTLENLMVYCQQVSSKFYNYPNFDITAISKYAEGASMGLANCQTLMLRIHDEPNEKGQLVTVRKASDKLLAIGGRFSSDIQTEIKTYYAYWNTILIIVAGILVALYLVFMTVFSKTVSRNLKHINANCEQLNHGDFSEFAEYKLSYEFIQIKELIENNRKYINERSVLVSNLLESNFENNVAPLSNKDHLTKNLNLLQERLDENAKKQAKQDVDNETRRYINEGLANFANIMRLNSNNTEMLGDSLIKALVKYLDALQGGVFLTSEDNHDQLHLISAFAFDRKKYLERTLRTGEGLVGTCALEMKTINLTDVPEDYTLIRSGLGDAPPNNILIVPVKYEKNLVGVLELASMRKFNETEVSLTEQIAANLASTIITVRNNAKTAELLEKSQQQAAEMREQEEEMRQNMEELKATQEESSRREGELQGLLDAVGAGFYLIEYSTEGFIDKINARLSAFLDQSPDSIIGHKHQDVFSESSKIDLSVINDLIKSKSARRIKETLSWGSNEYVYTHTLSPIMTKNNEVIKILNLLTIDELKNE